MEDVSARKIAGHDMSCPYEVKRGIVFPGEAPRLVRCNGLAPFLRQGKRDADPDRIGDFHRAGVLAERARRCENA